MSDKYFVIIGARICIKTQIQSNKKRVKSHLQYSLKEIM